jgi:NUMOD3 motif
VPLPNLRLVVDNRQPSPTPQPERLDDYHCYLYRSRDGTPIYVGQGCGRRPWRKERRGAGVDAMIASGEAVGPEIIAILETQAQAWAEEIRVIALYGRKCDGGTLWNKTLGGSGARGVKMSPEHKAKLRAASHTAESIAKAAAANRGRKHTDEARAKMSDAAPWQKVRPSFRGAQGRDQGRHNSGQAGLRSPRNRRSRDGCMS